MTNIPDTNTFVKAYADKAPWDIGKKLDSMVDLQHNAVVSER